MKLTVPLRYKFLSVLLGILVSALALFFYFAYDTFSEDKKLFVMDLNMGLVKSAISEVKLELKGRLEDMQILAPRVFQAPKPAEIKKEDLYQGLTPGLETEVFRITFFKKTDQKGYEVNKQYINQELLKQWELGPDFAAEVDKKHPLNLNTFSESQSLELLNRSTRSEKRQVALLTFLLSGSFAGTESKSVIISIDLVQDFLKKKLQQSEIAELFLISKSGNLISHPDPNKIVEYSSTPYPHPIVDRLQRSRVSRESAEVDVAGEKYLCNVAETGFRDIYAVAQIKKSEAFAALKTLLMKSTILAGLILCAAFIASILFAGKLTSNIQKLKVAAEELGRGNLDVSLDIRSNDEIKSVSDSFQWMAKRLGELIAESATKARMENELETARLVQSTLLTTPEVHTDLVGLISHYVPATECGGDFWDAFLYKDELLTVIIGDATGHGVPAALLTAIAKSSFSTLNEVYSQTPLLPEQFLGILNETIYKACKGQLLMTMCIAQVNLQTGELLISNAGHESPICLRAKVNTEPEATDTKVRRRQPEVLFARGERLGFSADASYGSTKFQLDEGDTLLLYTDGISEATDVSGKEWGERALKKVYAAGGARPLESIRDEIMGALNEHIKGAVQGDDITFVLINWKSVFQKVEQAPEVPTNTGNNNPEVPPDTGNNNVEAA
ncbi:MAG: SpoIIE family protein phosphatase [Deltaproteobacteria bacterium]|nr:SpoIIE family protein phosphatase [Deltaproteobacteria bacterium]